MILRTCDRCGKEMEPIYFPPFANYGAGLGCGLNESFRPMIMVSVTEEIGKTRPVDLCEDCMDDIYNEIFNFNNEVKVK